MTFAYAGTMGTQPGRRDEVVRVLTKFSPALIEVGCLRYDVGIDDAHPDTVFIAELWTSEEGHRASRDLPSIRAAYETVAPWLTGEETSLQFEIAGSPLER